MDVGGTVPDLAAIRNRRGLTLREIADTTRISVFYLRAIEEGQLQKLPGGFYNRSYIRQYAQAIDYDENELVERFGVAAAPEVEPPDAAEQGGALSRFGHWMLYMMHSNASRRTG